MIVPSDQIGASAGIFETFEIALGQIGLKWLAPVIFLMLVYGALASFATGSSAQARVY